jgi:lipopolysaccharide export system permease protein
LAEGVSPRIKSQAENELKSLDHYILRQMWTPFLFATLVVTAIVWLTQSLQRIDILIEHGQTLARFGWLTLLIVPSLLVVIIPFGLFAAAIYALHRLHSDSEIAVMFAAGVSRADIARPILLITLIGAAATFWINIDLMPRSYRELKREVAEMRADFASAIVRSGEFITLDKGFTVYVDNVLANGQFSGLLIHDYRDGDNAETYMAQDALLRETGIGPVLYLATGNVQRVNKKSGEVEIAFFDKTVINLGQFERSPGELQLEMTERYVGELFKPDLTKAYDRENAARLVGEGHGRIASPVYAFAYVLIAIFALIGGPYDRRGYAIRITIACASVGLLRVIGYVVQGLASDINQYWLIYLVPISAVLITSALIADIAAERSPRAHRKLKKLDA